MNKPIIFVAGLIIGAGSGILATWQYFKTKYETQAQEEIQDALDYIRETQPYGYRGEQIMEDNAEINPSEPDLDKIKEKLLKNEAQTTNYASMYKQKNEADPVQEKFKEAEDLADVETDEETPEERANREHQENRNKPPQIISVEEYENLEPYITKDTLFYYHYDEIVTDENDNEIPDPETYIGDALDKYGFRESDEPIIFVMNYATDTAYEIQRVMGGYTDL